MNEKEEKIISVGTADAGVECIAAKTKVSQDKKKARDMEGRKGVYGLALPYRAIYQRDTLPPGRLGRMHAQQMPWHKRLPPRPEKQYHGQRS
jgi:hypothetical protein